MPKTSVYVRLRDVPIRVRRRHARLIAKHETNPNRALEIVLAAEFPSSFTGLWVDRNEAERVLNGSLESIAA
jgi:hypothetical protein